MTVLGTELNKYEYTTPKTPVGTVAMPVRDHVNAATMMSLLHTDWTFLGTDGLDQHIIQAGVLTMQRNEAVQRMRGDFLLFIDDDMTWPPDAVGKLVNSYYDLRDEVDEPVMVGGLCFRRSHPYAPTLYMRETPTSGAYNFLERWDDGLVEVDATGCAFLLIPVEVFEAIAGTPMPSYAVRKAMGRLPSFFRWDKEMGEDVRFCQDAKEAGVRIFVDTRIEIGHVSEIIVTRQEYLQAIAGRTPETEAERLRVNSKMGLPTVTREEAREALGW